MAGAARGSGARTVVDAVGSRALWSECFGRRSGSARRDGASDLRHASRLHHRLRFQGSTGSPVALSYAESMGMGPQPAGPAIPAGTSAARRSVEPPGLMDRVALSQPAPPTRSAAHAHCCFIELLVVALTTNDAMQSTTTGGEPWP
eukprot:1292723-Prymnesium_polylepis.1